MNRHLVVLVALVVLSVGCGLGADRLTGSISQQTEAADAAVQTADAGPSGACWDGTVLPRPAQDPTPGPSARAAVEAWRSAMEAWKAAATEFSVEASAHAAAYESAAGPIVGKACTQDQDCDTASPDFVGSCRIYYSHGQCEVRDLHPLGAGPVAPPQPVFSCADFSCPQDFQCELEVETQGIACVLDRCGGGGHGGGTGGRGGGNHDDAGGH